MKLGEKKMNWFRILYEMTNFVDLRTSGGRLHLLQDVGKIPLADATLIEEPNDSDREDESKIYYV